MPGSVGNLFGKYSLTYSKVGEDENRVPLSQKELRKASRNELRGFDGEGLRVNKRGGNFLDRIVCWLEDRVFSLTRSGQVTSSRQERSEKFVEHVSDALVEIGVERAGIKEHELIKQIESVRKRDLPLRSGFVQSILRKVATQVRDSGRDGLPDIAKTAFPAENPEEEVVRHERNLPLPAEHEVVPQDNQHEVGPQFQDNRGVRGGDRNRELAPHGVDPRPYEPNEEAYEKFQNLTGADFTEKLCPYTELVLGNCLDDELRKRKSTISLEQRNDVVKATTLELASMKFGYGNEDGDYISPTMRYAKETYRTAYNADIRQQAGKSADVMESDTLAEISYLILEGNEQPLKNYISDYLNYKRMGVAHAEGVQDISRQPLHDQRDAGNYLFVPNSAQAEPVVGDFQFAQQSEEEFKNSLFEPVKAKLVNPVLKHEGYYDGDYTDKKMQQADEITSQTVDHVIVHYKSVKNAKEAADENLVLVRLSADTVDSDEQLQKQALEALIESLASNHGRNMKAGVEVLYQHVTGNALKAGGDLQHVQAPQMLPPQPLGAVRDDFSRPVGTIGVNQPNSGSSVKGEQMVAFTDKLENSRGAGTVYEYACDVIKEAGYEPNVVLNDNDSPVYAAFQEHLYGDKWGVHKRNAEQIFSGRYDAAAQTSAADLFKVAETDSLTIFRRQFKFSFRNSLHEIQV